MNDKSGPIEPVVIIPPGMDCRELKFRVDDRPGADGMNELSVISERTEMK